MSVPSWPYMAIDRSEDTQELKMRGMFAEVWFELEVKIELAILAHI